jgi:hypothetical protein
VAVENKTEIKELTVLAEGSKDTIFTLVFADTQTKSEQ